jgi:hypothetical protein
MTNWASRQGFTELRARAEQVTFHGDKNAKLTKGQEILSGTIGGIMVRWNHP